jgi:CheY-like chemotaxis protein
MNSQPDLQPHRHIRTLLVDDSPLMREFLTILVGRENGFEIVATAADGLQALRSVAALRPELILMDVDMPCLDGLAATRTIRQSAAQIGYAPVIVMVTANDTLTCRSLAEEAGANGFVPKSENLGAQLRSTLANLFSGNVESLPANLVEDTREICCA